jgi:AcrR family transcriptional regulator
MRCETNGQKERGDFSTERPKATRSVNVPPHPWENLVGRSKVHNFANGVRFYTELQMGIAERKLRQKEEVRHSILEAAWQIVTDEGWQALSIRKIADAIEYSVPVIYDHFANKEAILLELTRQGFRLLNEEMSKAKKRYSEPEKQIEAMAYSYWEFAFEHKAYYQVMYGLGMPSCETVSQISELGTFSELVMQPIKDLIAESKSPDTDAKLKLHTFWSMLHGMISINMMNNTQEKAELNQMVIQDFIAAFIAGIKR